MRENNIGISIHVQIGKRCCCHSVSHVRIAAADVKNTGQTRHRHTLWVENTPAPVKYAVALNFLRFLNVFPLSPPLESRSSGVVQNVKEQQRHRERLRPPYPCECRFGSGVPLGCLQQANYRASVTQRGGAERVRSGGGRRGDAERLRQIIRLGAARLPPRY